MVSDGKNLYAKLLVYHMVTKHIGTIWLLYGYYIWVHIGTNEYQQCEQDIRLNIGMND